MRASYLFIMVFLSALVACEQQSHITEQKETTTTPMAQASSDAAESHGLQAVVSPTKDETTASSTVDEPAKQAEQTVETTSADQVVIKADKTVAVPTDPASSKATAELKPEFKAGVEPGKPEMPQPAVVTAKGNAAQGAKLAKKCSACHTFDQGGKKKTGPNLFAIVGKVQGSAEGFKYGSYLAAQHAAENVWDEASLRAWLADSKAVAKAAGEKSKMPAQKITGSKADDLIAYLKSLK